MEQVVQRQKSSSLKIIIIIAIIVVVLAVVGVVLMIVLDGWGDWGVGRKYTLQECLEIDPEPTECYLIFKELGSFEKCEKLAEKSDECLYNTALAKENLDLCEKISDEEMKNQCKEDVLSFLVMEDEI